MRLIHLFACIALFFTPLVFAQPQNPKQQEEAKKFVEKGQQLYEQGKIKQALEAYKKANELSPESPGPYREIGRCYRDLKQHEQAFHYLSGYLSRKPTADEREGILKYLEEQRPLLSKKNKALLTLNSEPQGAVVFVIDSKGQETGIGVTPLKNQPIPSDAVSVRLMGTAFEAVEERFEVSQSPLELTSILDPQKRPKSAAVELKATDKPTPKRTRAYVYFGVGAASTAGALVLGAQFNKSVEALDNTASDDPELDRIFRIVVAEAIAADVLGAIAVGSGVLGVLQLRKVKNEKKGSREKTSALRITPSGVTLSGRF